MKKVARYCVSGYFTVYTTIVWRTHTLTLYTGPSMLAQVMAVIRIVGTMIACFTIISYAGPFIITRCRG